jgi:HAD superfamily hydrolase (TIGR01509 family)
MQPLGFRSAGGPARGARLLLAAPPVQPMSESLSEPVVVLPFDPAWEAAYRAEARRLLQALGGHIVAIHHIGSTSVPGLAAKPIIDLLLEVADLGVADAFQRALVRLGYQALGEHGLPGRRYLRRVTEGRRSHHLHVYPSGHSGLRRHLAFRDYLRRHPAARQQYGELKLHLAAKHPLDRQAYISGKNDLVTALERDALAWAEAAGQGTRIEALLLDADGVVQQTGPGWRDSLAALCTEEHRVDDFLSEVFAAERPCLTGAGEFGAALEGVLQRWSCQVPLDDALKIWTLIEPDQQVLGLVRRLRERGVTVALATNQQQHRADYMGNALGYAECFDDLCYSWELGHAKPSPEYFAAVLARLAVAPGQALFIDDHPCNVDAARAAGLAAEVFHVDSGIESLCRLLADHGLAAD